MSTENKSIKFPDKHYVGFQARPSHDEVPLGFMTPFGTDKAFEKRKGTVDTWSRGGGYYGRNEAQDKLPAQTYDNKPMVGFKLGRNVRHGYGWGQGNVKWRIEDPRGFELEITSPNLAQIMGFCTIQEGEILEECIWARMGNENILVPVNSDVYMNAIKNTERMAKSASLKDLKIGDSAVFHNGDQGIYYGAYFIVSRAHSYSDTNKGHYLKFGDKKKHVFLMQGADGLTATKWFKAIASPKLSQVFEGEAMTHEDAERKMAKMVAEEGYSLDESTNDYGKSPIAFVIEKKDASQFTLERVEDDLSRVEQYLKDNHTMSTGDVQTYYATNAIHSAMPIFEIQGTDYSIQLRDIFDKREYLPGGKNHAQAVTHSANVAANPSYYGNRNHSYTRVAATEVVNSPMNEGGKIYLKETTRSYYSSYNHSVEIEVVDVPETFYYMRMVGKSNAGTEIICAI